MVHQQKARVEQVEKAKEEQQRAAAEAAPKAAKVDSSTRLPLSNWGLEAEEAEKAERHQKEAALLLLQKTATPAEKGPLANMFHQQQQSVLAQQV